MSNRLLFPLFHGCEGISIAGPQQAFHEANRFGADYEILNYGVASEILTEQGLKVAGLEPLPDPSTLTEDDRIFVIGYTPERSEPPAVLIRWLARANERRVRIVSICSGAFILGMAGILDGRSCTTHWKRCDLLQERFPRAKVMRERLFTEDGRLLTSGGGASCIDLALYMIERDFGPLVAGKVAREMVVYFRRDAEDRQMSVYLDYRTHLRPSIYAVQDILNAHPETEQGIDEIARAVGMSPRNMTRAFRQATGISVGEYRTKVRLERASGLLKSPGYTVDAVASLCGFSDARQLRRLWKRAYSSSPKGAGRGEAGI